MHPGKAGQWATKTPSSSCSMITRNFISPPWTSSCVQPIFYHNPDTKAGCATLSRPTSSRQRQSVSSGRQENYFRLGSSFANFSPVVQSNIKPKLVSILLPRFTINSHICLCWPSHLIYTSRISFSIVFRN